MTNDIFRFYADDPDLVFDFLRKHWRSAIVRWDGRKVGASNVWLMVVVLDDTDAATAFRNWLGTFGIQGDLRIRRRPLRPMLVANTIVVRKSVVILRRITRWFRHSTS